VTLAIALGLATIAGAFVAWPLVRPPQEPPRPEPRPWQGEAELEWEMRLDAAAGRVPLGELDALRARIRDLFGPRS
jgi:hypothetical protein